VTAPARLDPQHGLVRGVRAAVLAVAAVGVGALAHRSADRCLDVPGLLLALGTCWSGAVAVLGARRRLPALLAWLVAAQLVTHLMLKLTCSSPGALVPGPRALAAHLLAVVVLALVLHDADRDLWVAHGLAGALLRLLAPRLAVVVPPGAPAVVPAASRVPHPRATLHASPVVRRGPPSQAGA
jgi:hypothetical protein